MKSRPEFSRNHVPSADEVRELTAQLAGLLTIVNGKHAFLELERRTGIDRAKLTGLANGEEKKLSLTEMLALDSLLGGRFTDALRGMHRSVIDELCRASTITFILGARELQWADHVSRWDVKAMTTLLHSIHERGGDAPEIRVEEVLQRPVNGMAPTEYREQTALEPWYDQLDRQNGQAFVVFGSPRASHVAEYMLCRMFDEEAFSVPKNPLPFNFLWTPQLYRELPSTFSTVATAAGREPPSGIVGMRIENTEHLIDDTEPSWQTFGAGAAQRRKNGQFWLVAAGATGTATAAVSAAVPQIRGVAPPRGDAGTPSPVLWFAVQAEVKREGQRGGDNRILVRDHLLGEAKLWDPVSRQSKPFRSVPPPSQGRTR